MCAYVVCIGLLLWTETQKKCFETFCPFNINDEYINKANEDTLLTVFKEKHHKSAEAFKFTQKFFIDSKTKKYCYIYNFAL